MWEHRDHTIHKIDTCTSFQRFSIKCTILLNIICHIRNMHSKHIVFSFTCDRNSIIQIFGIFPINSYHLPVSQILTSCHISFTDWLCHTHSLIQHTLREFCRKIIAFYNGQDICPRIIHMTNNFNYLSFRFSSFFSVRSKLCHYFVPIYRTF